MYRAALYSKRLSLYIGDILFIDKARTIMIKIKNVVSCTVAFVTAFAAHSASASGTSTVETANTSNTSINQAADATANADVPNNNYERFLLTSRSLYSSRVSKCSETHDE